MRKIQISIACLLLLMGVSCIKDKPDASECKKKILILFDWSTVIEPGADERVNVIITNSQNQDQTMLLPPSGQEVDLNTGVYKFTGYTDVDNVTVDGTTVTVNQNADGSYPEPDEFTGGSISQEIIETDSDQTVTIPMRQQTRPLIIRVILKGPALAYFSYIDAEISGIAFSRDINNGFVPLDGNALHLAYVTGSVAYDLTLQSGNTYSDSKVLLGIDGDSSQMVTFIAHFNSGAEKQITVNVTSDMYGFHTENVKEPWVLEFTINLITEIEGTIENWAGDYESNLSVN